MHLRYHGARETASSEPRADTAKSPTQSERVCSHALDCRGDERLFGKSVYVPLLSCLSSSTGHFGNGSKLASLDCGRSSSYDIKLN